jgi:hypothetical protein
VQQIYPGPSQGNWLNELFPQNTGGRTLCWQPANMKVETGRFALKWLMVKKSAVSQEIWRNMGQILEQIEDIPTDSCPAIGLAGR